MSVRSTQSQVRVRQEKARENARREILLAAAGVFARRGYAAATLADLAQAAGYAAPSLYRYFASKEEIFGSLLELMRQELAATFEAPVAPGQPLAARLASLLALQMELTARRREVFAVLLRDRPAEEPGKPALPYHLAGQAFYQELLLAWLRRHVSPRELRCSLPDAASTLTGVVSSFHHGSQLAGAPAPDAGQVHHILDLVLNGLSASPAPGPARSPRSHTS